MKSKFGLTWLKGMCGHEHVRCMHYLMVCIEGALTSVVHWDLKGGVRTSEMEELQVKQRRSQNPFPLFTNAGEGHEGEEFWDLQGLFE